MVTKFDNLHNTLIKLANNPTENRPKIKSKVLSRFLVQDEPDSLNIRFNKRSYTRYGKLGPSSILRDKFD